MPEAFSREAEAAALALNNAHATELSWLEPDQFSALIGQAFHAARIGSVSAFVIAFDEAADYQSPNYLWFRGRYQKFVYVDRIVVDPAQRGRGHARALYAEVIKRAVATGRPVIVCEVNIDPPNPRSDSFHAALGFTEVGSASLAGSGKTVRYLALQIAADQPPPLPDQPRSTTAPAPRGFGGCPGNGSAGPVPPHPE